jgi:hypothetical protein
MNLHGHASETDDDTLSATNLHGKTPEASSSAASQRFPHPDDDHTEGKTANPWLEHDCLAILLHISLEAPEPLLATQTIVHKTKQQQRQHLISSPFFLLHKKNFLAKMSLRRKM